jgi:hypothetical protein
MAAQVPAAGGVSSTDGRLSSVQHANCCTRPLGPRVDGNVSHSRKGRDVAAFMFSVITGDLDALANPLLAGSRKCCADGRHRSGIGAIAEFLSMVLAERRQVERE